MTRALRNLGMAALLLAAACITKENTGTNTVYAPAPQGLPEFTRTYSLQGAVIDANNGTRITGTDLYMRVVTGATIFSPARLMTDAADPLAGEYAFTGLPLDYNTNNQTFKMVVVKPGYERFEADLAYTPATGTMYVDTVFNYIGNVYLFPIGTNVPSFTVQVLYNGKAVPNATVLLDPVVASNNTTFNTGDALAATNGLVASLTATTGATGQATFPASQLALGGAYNIQILPVAFTNTAGTVVQLGRYESTTNQVMGVADTFQTVALSDTTPTAQPLYVVSASNRSTNAITGVTGLPAGMNPGYLSVTFNAPIRISSSTAVTGALASSTGVTFAAALAATPVTASVSTDGLTLTLNPAYTAYPVVGELGLYISYIQNAFVISPRDFPGAAFDLFTGGAYSQVLYADGTGVDVRVNINATGNL
jgi:hypothetical protein